MRSADWRFPSISARSFSLCWLRKSPKIDYSIRRTGNAAAATIGPMWGDSVDWQTCP